jgi:hypothetical protein
MSSKWGGVLKEDFVYTGPEGRVHWKRGEFVEIPGSWKYEDVYRVQLARGGMTIVVQYKTWAEVLGLFTNTGYGDRRNGGDGHTT